MLISRLTPPTSGLCCDRAPDGERAAEIWFEARVARIRLGAERVERLAEEAARGGCHNHVEYVRVREPEFAQVRYIGFADGGCVRHDLPRQVHHGDVHRLQSGAPM